MSDTTVIRSTINWSAVISAPFRVVGKAFAIIHAANQQAVLAQKLYSLSDAELARRGLTREQIPQVVLGAINVS